MGIGLAVGIVVAAWQLATAPDGPAPTPVATATSTSDEHPVDHGWAAVARGFGQTFTNTTLGQPAWFTAVSSWLTDEQAAMYRDVPVTDIPTGRLRTVAVDDPGRRHTTRGRLTYDTGLALDIGLVYLQQNGGWLVGRVTLAGRD